MATNRWTGTSSEVGVTSSNGGARIGSRLYFSGGFVAVGTHFTPTDRVFAYDYGDDRLIERAPLPKRTAAE